MMGAGSITGDGHLRWKWLD